MGLHGVCQAMADLGSVTFEGQSGNQYAFRAYTFDHPLRRVGAVYTVLHSVPKPGGGYVMNPLYFGQTGDITERFEGHHRQQCFQRNASTASRSTSTRTRCRGARRRPTSSGGGIRSVTGRSERETSPRGLWWVRLPDLFALHRSEEH